MVFSQMAFPVIILPHITRVLGVRNIGIFNLVDSFAQYFIMFAALGIPIYGIRAISQASAKSKQILNSTFSELVTIQAFLTIVLLVVYYCFVYFNPTVNLHKYYYILGSIQFMMGVFSVEWFFQGTDNFKFISIRTFIIKVISIIAIFLLINEKTDAYLYYVISTLSYVLIAILNVLMLSNNVRFVLPRFSSIFLHVKPLLTFFTTRFVVSIYVSFSIILIGFLSTEREVGFFTLAYKAYNVVIALINTIPIVIISRATILIQNKQDYEYKALIENVFSIVVFIGIPATFCVFLYSDEIVYLLGGAEFLQSSLLLKILSLLVIVISLSSIFALNVLTPLKKEKFFLISAITGMIISLGTNFFLIPKYGSIGASISLLLAEIAVFIMLAYYCGKTFTFNFKIKSLGLYVIACLPFILIYYTIHNYSHSAIITLIIGSAISLLLYYILTVFIFKDKLIADYHKIYFEMLLNKISNRKNTKI